MHNPPLGWENIYGFVGGGYDEVAQSEILKMEDAWISMLIAGLVGISIAFLATRLSLLYPKQALVEFSQTILGKWLG